MPQKMKIATSSMTKEIATPSISGVRTVWYESVASSLTPERLATIIQQVDQNDILEYLTLAEEMEERDLHYHSVLSTRKLAVSGLNVVVESYSDDAEHVKIADYVSEVVKDDAFKPLIAGQLDALGKGYAVSEIMWDRSESQWFPVEYKWRDPRHFQFDIETGSELRMRDESDAVNGVGLVPNKFCVHYPRIKTGLPIRGGLARLAVVAYMCKGYTIKDWMSFAEVFGMPLRIGKYDKSATPDQKAALLNAVASIGTDAACIIEESMMIEFAESSKVTGGEKLFPELGNWLDAQVSKGVLGQTATTEGTPGRLGSDDAQNQVREDIKIDDAAQLSATLQKYIVKPVVDWNFGRQKRGHYPILKIFTEKPEDLEMLSKSLPPFIDRGLRVQSSVILDKFGLQEPEDDSEILQPKTGATPQATASTRQEREQVAVELMRAVRRGETLTEDQRMLLVASMAAERAQQSTTVQTLLLSKERFKSVEAARKWVTDNKYNAAKVDETEKSYRFRQREPGDFKPDSFRTIELTEGVKAVIGKLKAETARQQDDDGDEIDRLVDGELDGWKRLMDPIFKPIIDHAKASSNYEEFLEGLEDAATNMDSTLFAERIAVAQFKARGLGDGTDDL